MEICFESEEHKDILFLSHMNEHEYAFEGGIIVTVTVNV